MTRLPILLLAGAGLSFAAACSHSPAQLEVAHGEQRRLQANEVTAELKIGAVVTGEKLGEPERKAIRHFASAFQDEGHGAVVISRPSNGPDDVAALRASADARAVLLAQGIDPGVIKEGPYDANAASSAPLILSYRTWEASVPGCPDLSSIDMVWTGTNTSLPSFGCAVAVNLAAQLADAGDLVGDQPDDPQDTSRRMIVITKYRAGEPTAGAKNSGASGVISGAVGG